MKTFTDAAGRTWTLSLTLGSAMDVKDKLGVDLLQIEAGDPPLITRLGTDEMLLGQVICALIEDQFEAHHATAKDVVKAFDGKTLAAVQSAFYAELIDFFRQRGRADRATAVDKQQRMIEAAIRAVGLRLEAVDVDETIRTAMGRGAMSGSSPESLESTPGR